MQTVRSDMQKPFGESGSMPRHAKTHTMSSDTVMYWTSQNNSLCWASCVNSVLWSGQICDII